MGRRYERVVQLTSQEYGLIDLSSDGAAFLCPEAIQSGAEVFVLFETLMLRSTVIYCTLANGGFRVGIQFEEQNNELHTTLEKITNEFSKGVPYDCKIMQPAEVGIDDRIGMGIDTKIL